MRARMNFRRTIVTAVLYLALACAGTSYLIHLNQGPNGIVWFPCIVGGWFLIGGAATWFGVVLSTQAVVWTRWQTTPPRRMPSRAEVGRPPVRPLTPEQSATITARMEEDYAAGVRAAKIVHSSTYGLIDSTQDPAPDLQVTADRVREGFAARTGGGASAMEAFDAAVEGKPAGYIPSHGIDPVTGRLYVDGKPVMPAAAQRVVVPTNPSPGLVDALVRAHGGTSRGHTFTVGASGPNPALDVTEADV